MFPRRKTWSYSRPQKNAPNRAIEIINPAIISAEASPSGVLLDGKGKETEITFKPKNKPKSPKEEIEDDPTKEPRKKPAQRLLETLSKKKGRDTPDRFDGNKKQTTESDLRCRQKKNSGYHSKFKLIIFSRIHFQYFSDFNQLIL